MNRPLRLFITAGEASGDVLAADLVAELRARAPHGLEMQGIGGPALAAEGLASLFPMDRLSVMGLAEIVPRIGELLQLIDRTARAARRFQPDLVVTVDSPDFSFRVAQRLKRAGVGPLVHLGAPTVWAWRPKRAGKVAALYDLLLCLFPFEPPYFEAVGLDALFIGHPLATREVRAQARPDGPILLLPGSRRGEVSRLAEPFAATAEALERGRAGMRFILPTFPHLVPLVERALSGRKAEIEVLTRPDEKRAAFTHARAALAASGTVSLELAAFGVPHVVAYRVHPISAAILRRMLSIRTVTILNLLLDRQAVAELLQEECTVPMLTGAMQSVLADPAAQRQMLLEAMELLRRPAGIDLGGRLVELAQRRSSGTNSRSGLPV